MNNIQRIMEYYQVDEATARQALALAPASALLSKATSSGGVSVSTFLISGAISFFFGVLLGPAIFGASKAGAERLREIAERKIRGK